MLLLKTCAVPRCSSRAVPRCSIHALKWSCSRGLHVYLYRAWPLRHNGNKDRNAQECLRQEQMNQLNSGKRIGLPFVQICLCLQVRFEEQVATLIICRINRQCCSGCHPEVLSSPWEQLSLFPQELTRVLSGLQRGRTHFGDLFLYASTFTWLPMPGFWFPLLQLHFLVWILAGLLFTTFLLFFPWK